MGYFSLVLLKMMIKHIKTGHNFFFQKETKFIFFEKSLIKDFDNHFNSVNRNPIQNKALMSKTSISKKNAQLKILKKVRITHSENIMDTLTFSRDLIDNIDKLIDLFWNVSNKNIFFCSENYRDCENYWEKLPSWFQRTGLHSISEWIVAQFEIRIFEFYKKFDQDQVYKITCLQKREIYIDIWKKLDFNEKKNLVEKTVSIIDNFPASVLKGNDLEKNLDGETQNSFEEIVFDFLRSYHGLDISKLKNFKESIVKKILDMRDQMGDSNFVRMAVASNLTKAVEIEYFFMAKLAFAFENLHYKNLFLIDENENKNKKKKKKNKKKKNKNNKKEDSVNENSNFEVKHSEENYDMNSKDCNKIVEEINPPHFCNPIGKSKAKAKTDNEKALDAELDTNKFNNEIEKISSEKDKQANNIKENFQNKLNKSTPYPTLNYKNKIIPIIPVKEINYFRDCFEKKNEIIKQNFEPRFKADLITNQKPENFGPVTIEKSNKEILIIENVENPKKKLNLQKKSQLKKTGKKNNSHQKLTNFQKQTQSKTRTENEENLSYFKKSQTDKIEINTNSNQDTQKLKLKAPLRKLNNDQTSKDFYSALIENKKEEEKNASFKQSLDDYDYNNDSYYTYYIKKDNFGNFNNELLYKKKRRHSSTNFDTKDNKEDIKSFFHPEPVKENLTHKGNNEKMEIYFKSEKKKEFEFQENNSELKAEAIQQSKPSKLKKKPKLKKIERNQKTKYWENSKTYKKTEQNEQLKQFPKLEKTTGLENSKNADKIGNNIQKNDLTNEIKINDSNEIKDEEKKEKEFSLKKKVEQEKDIKNDKSNQTEKDTKNEKLNQTEKNKKLIIEKKTLKNLSYWKDEDEIDFMIKEKQKNQKKLSLKHKSITISSGSTKTNNKNLPKVKSNSLNFKRFIKLTPVEKIKIDTALKKEIILKQVSKQFYEKLWEYIEKVVGNLINFSQNLENKRSSIIKKIENITKESFPQNEIFLKVYGSYATKLLTPFSDVDLSIQHQNQFLGKNGAVQMLDILDSNLRLCDFVCQTQPILTAIVPVLKIYVDVESNLVEKNCPIPYNGSLDYNNLVNKQNEKDLLKDSTPEIDSDNSHLKSNYEEESKEKDQPLIKEFLVDERMIKKIGSFSILENENYNLNKSQDNCGLENSQNLQNNKIINIEHNEANFQKQFSNNFQDTEKEKTNISKNQIQFDITVDLSNPNFPSTSHRTTEFINFCISKYPSFYKNLLFLKYIFSYKDFSNTYKGGLNAYGLSIMYIAYLEKNNQVGNQNHHEVLFGFLGFLCKEFNPNFDIISLGYNLSNSKNPILKKQNFDFSHLTIYDPTSIYFNNVTPNCKLISEIITFFLRSLSLCENLILNISNSFQDCLDFLDSAVIMNKVNQEILLLNGANPLDFIFSMNFNF